jgi:hypothetical protein
MRKPLRQCVPRRSSLLDRWLPPLVMACVAAVFLGMTAGGTGSVFAQQPKSKTDAEARKKTGAAATRPILGAGQTVDAAALARIIDEEIDRRLKQEKIPPSDKCDDAEFIRRVYLDLTGVIPPVERVKSFLDSKDPQRRSKLVEELLNDPNYAKQLAETWTTLLTPPNPDARGLSKENLNKWLDQGFAANKPWNKMVEELLTATGTIDDNGATIFYVANNSVDKMTNEVTKLFMGVQLQCAQCHNHPFTGWKQEEYWGMAAFFMKVKQDGTPKSVAKDGGTITISEVAGTPAKGAGVGGKGKKNNLPEGAKLVPAKFLASERPSIGSTTPPRPVLAKWLTSAENPYFARAMVNRVWAQFFGRGFVNPIDDIHDDNPASHPELFMAITEQFKRNNFDIKYLARAVVLSEAYQRTSRPNKDNETDTDLFSRVYIKTMTPEQLFDSIAQVVGGTPKGAGFGGPGVKGAGKKGVGGGGPRAQFINFFRVEEGADPLEYQDGIPQALRLMNSPQLNNGGKALQEAMQRKTPTDAVEFLFLAALSRRPTTVEMNRLTEYVRKRDNQRTAYTDILWSLLNCSEFRLNH